MSNRNIDKEQLLSQTLGHQKDVTVRNAVNADAKETQEKRPFIPGVRTHILSDEYRDKSSTI